jgi:Tfp pilus assembly protein PilF
VLINLGHALLQAGLPAQAAAANHPGLVQASFGLANVCAEQGKLKEAEALYQEAHQGMLKDPTAPAQRAPALRKGGQFDEAEARCREAADLSKQKAESLCNLGTVRLQQGQVKEAEKCFREALQLNRNLSEAHVNLGFCLQRQGQTDAAAECFREALRCNAKMFPAHANLGAFLLQQGKLDEAEVALRAAIGLSSDQACLHTMLGACLIKQGRHKEAEAPCREAVRLDGARAEFHTNLGHLLSNLGLYAESLTEMQRGHELGQKRPGWRYPSADWVKEAQARVTLETRLPDALAGKYQPGSGGEWSDLARACRARKLHSAAVQCYLRAFEQTPTLLIDPQRGNRVLALRSAALASCGQGEQAPTNPVERARLRRQALAWLRQEASRWESALQKATPEQQILVRRALEQLVRESDLAALRDDEALARLPASERAEWSKAWSEIEALSKRAGTK